MKGLNPTNLRRERKNQLLNLVIEHQPITQNKICGLFSLKTGLKFTTILEMLSELEAAEIIIRDGEEYKSA